MNSYVPLVLLGIRTAVKTDLGHSVSEMVYDTTLCLSGEFLSQPGPYFLRRPPQTNPLRLQSPQDRPRHHNAHVPKYLQTFTHIFIHRAKTFTTTLLWPV